jgi:hypothetical protein
MTPRERESRISMARRSKLSNSHGSTRVPGGLDSVFSVDESELESVGMISGSSTVMVVQFSKNTLPGIQ